MGCFGKNCAEPLRGSMIKIFLPFKTPTINHLYGYHGVRKFLKKEAKELRERIGLICNELDLSDELNELRNKRLEVCVYVSEDWYTKKGDVKRKDVANREKFLIDSVFDALQIDDKMIFKHTMEKVQLSPGYSDCCIIEVKEYED